MSPEEAVDCLRGAKVVPILKGSVSATKELRQQCLDIDVPAAIVRPPQGGG
jgi:hypothetical protein